MNRLEEVIWRLSCLDCNFDETVRAPLPGDPSNGPPQDVVDEVTLHKYQNPNHVVRVHPHPEEPDPSLVTDGGTCTGGFDQWCQELAEEMIEFTAEWFRTYPVRKRIWRAHDNANRIVDLIDSDVGGDRDV